jgi:hypothetical protein
MVMTLPVMSRRDVVDAAGVPGIAAQQTPRRQPCPPDRTMPGDRDHRVLRARRVEPTGRWSHRRDVQLVAANEHEQDAAREPDHRPRDRAHRDLDRGMTTHARTGRRDRRAAVSSATSRSAPRSAYARVAAGASARTTTPASAGIVSSRARTRARRRRLTLFRVTAFPMDLDTTRPTTGPGPGSVRVTRCTTSDSRPPRAPRRTACSNSAGRRIRCAAGSTGADVRPRALRDPCADERRGSRGLHVCACADGSRGSWPGAGCSAGTCAWSRVSPTTSGHRSRTDTRPGLSAELDCSGSTRSTRDSGARARQQEPSGRLGNATPDERVGSNAGQLDPDGRRASRLRLPSSMIPCSTSAVAYRHARTRHVTRADYRSSV